MRLRPFRFWAACLIAAIYGALTSPTSAAAQGIGTCEGVDQAAVLTQLGASLAERGAWDSAAICFERLQSRVTDDAARADATFNLGIAYQSLGRHRDARNTFAEWLERHGATATPETRAEVTQLFTQESGRVGALVLTLPTPAVEGLEVRLDGRVVATTGNPANVEVDPGEHAIAVSAPNHTTFTWEGRVADGVREALEVVLVPVALPPPQGEDIAASPAFWVGMVLLAGAIAGGVVLGVYLQDDAQLDPRPGIEVFRR